MTYRKFLALIALASTCVSHAPYAFATGQIGDVLHIDGQEHSLVGVAGSLPTPETFGIKAGSTSTANWRGYYAEYALEDDRLVLMKLTVNSISETYPTINGVSADMELGVYCFGEDDTDCLSDGGVYPELNLPLEFTGKIRVATGFIEKFYVHMGFQKPSAFRVVLDLEFEDGVLIETNDRSEEAAKIRGQYSDEYRGKDPEEAVESAFSLRMEPLE